MNTESINITITQEGDVIVELQGASAEQLRHYREVLQELLGPVRKEIQIKADELPPSGVKMKETSKDPKGQKVRIR